MLEILEKTFNDYQGEKDCLYMLLLCSDYDYTPLDPVVHVKIALTFAKEKGIDLTEEDRDQTYARFLTDLFFFNYWGVVNAEILAGMIREMRQDGPMSLTYLVSYIVDTALRTASQENFSMFMTEKFRTLLALLDATYKLLEPTFANWEVTVVDGRTRVETRVT
ncbi:MAG: hypothetical protein NUV80_06855 [Candidatus Berkelbacteria bacterium]|nr:hypothetical protein [Candidatus Berkelbacteria bacterium]MCR4308250.1 hypothetical protein [Candidatus Berkelbacteria bacterium]